MQLARTSAGADQRHSGHIIIGDTIDWTLEGALVKAEA
jgi:hypothetical protein